MDICNVAKEFLPICPIPIFWNDLLERKRLGHFMSATGDWPF